MAAKNESIGVFFVFEDKVFSGGDASQSTKIKFEIVLIGVIGRLFAVEPAKMPLDAIVPSTSNSITVIIQDSKVS